MREATLYGITEIPVYVEDSATYHTIHGYNKENVYLPDTYEIMMPLDYEINITELPIHHLMKAKGDEYTNKYLMIHPNLEKLLRIPFQEERGKRILTEQSLKASRECKKELENKIERFNNLPLWKKIWKLITGYKIKENN